VVLRATWVLTPPPPPQGKTASAPAKQVTEETNVPASGTCSGADGVPQSMSRALGLLSDHIAGAISTATTAAR